MARTTTKLTKIEKRKRLEALFDRGDYVRFNRDADGRPVINPEPSDTDVKIWVSVPSPLQREMAIREAQAERARTMIEARDKEESSTWVTIHNYVRGLPVATLTDYLVDLDDTDYLTQARREVLTAKEWEDFNSLRDAMRKFEEAGAPVDDPEWKPLLDRDRAFASQVLDRAEEIRQDARDGYHHMARVQLEEQALEKRIEQAGSASFMTAYNEWMLFYSCRDDEAHGEMYFETPSNIRQLPQEVQDALAELLAKFITDSSEAKN